MSVSYLDRKEKPAGDMLRVFAAWRGNIIVPTPLKREDLGLARCRDASEYLTDRTPSLTIKIILKLMDTDGFEPDTTESFTAIDWWGKSTNQGRSISI